MVISSLKSPIVVFSLNDFGVNEQKYCQKTQKIFYDLEYDHYLYRQTRIEFLKKNLTPSVLEKKDHNFWFQYYAGIASEADIEELAQDLDEASKTAFDKIKPTRRRAISDFIINKDQCGDWQIKREQARTFEQNEALINRMGTNDYRLFPRKFKELDDKFIDDDFYKILSGIVTKIDEANGPIKQMKASVHHTMVETTWDNIGSNSPEGIHQDGMDYIVSALVIERHNVKGGKSIVFGSDSKTKILETTLRPGQGILQADKDTDLWHTVDALYPEDTKEYRGHRSSIGFDFSILN